MQVKQKCISQWVISVQTEEKGRKSLNMSRKMMDTFVSLQIYMEKRRSILRSHAGNKL